MTSKPRSLAELQCWMQEVITHPLGVQAGLHSDEARRHVNLEASDVEEVITRSHRRTSVERLEVYANAYYARLLECLREMFPILAATLGEGVVNRFAFEYLQVYPPGSYTLEHLADHFVEFLEATRPGGEDNQASSGEADWADFLVDLARLEWTIEKVFDGPGIEEMETLNAERLSAITPDQWPAARLIPAPCLRLLAFRFPVNDYSSQVRNGKEPGMPEPGETWLALHRRDYIVRRYPLSREQYELLSALTAGSAVGDAIESAAASTADLDELGENLHAWFGTWCGEQFFVGIE